MKAQESILRKSINNEEFSERPPARRKSPINSLGLEPLPSENAIPLYLRSSLNVNFFKKSQKYFNQIQQKLNFNASQKIKLDFKTKRIKSNSITQREGTDILKKITDEERKRGNFSALHSKKNVKAEKFVDFNLKDIHDQPKSVSRMKFTDLQKVSNFDPEILDL